MDSTNLEILDSRCSASTLPQYVLDQIFTDLRDFILRGEPFTFYPLKDEELNEFLAIFDLKEGVTQEQLAFCKIYGTIDGDDNTFTDKFEGKLNIIELLRYLPDRRWVFDDNINDYVASVAIVIDDTSLLIISEEQKEYDATCVTCDNDANGVCKNSHYDYKNEFWVLMIHPEDLHKVNWSSGEIW
jgi:hypothetical protein